MPGSRDWIESCPRSWSSNWCLRSRARALLNTYALRASDAVQLASCYHLQEELGHDVPFVVVDQRLAAAHESGATVMGTGGEEPE